MNEETRNLRDALEKLLIAVDNMDHTAPGQECPTCDFERAHDELLSNIRKLLGMPPQ